jgi:hypothetical protein
MLLTVIHLFFLIGLVSEMRSAPTLTIPQLITISNASSDYAQSSSSYDTIETSLYGFKVTVNNYSGLSIWQPYYMKADTNPIYLEAELDLVD